MFHSTGLETLDMAFPWIYPALWITMLAGVIVPLLLYRRGLGLFAVLLLFLIVMIPTGYLYILMSGSRMLNSMMMRRWMRDIPINLNKCHDDVIKWKHFPRYWPFVRGIHRSPVNHPHKGQWRGALMFSLICVWINGWENNREAGDLRRYRAHYYVIVMWVFCRLVMLL